MTIHSISSGNNLLPLLDNSQASQSSAANSISSSLGATTSAGTFMGSGDSATLSSQSKLFSQLQNLSQTNPTEFKKITGELAQEISSETNALTDPGEANFLNGMASSFKNASQSGNFSDLFSSQSSNSSLTAASPSYGPPPPYASPSSAPFTPSSSADPLTSIFSQALSQIQTDVSTSTNG